MDVGNVLLNHKLQEMADVHSSIPPDLVLTDKSAQSSIFLHGIILSCLVVLGPTGASLKSNTPSFPCPSSLVGLFWRWVISLRYNFRASLWRRVSVPEQRPLPLTA